MTFIYRKSIQAPLCNTEICFGFTVSRCFHLNESALMQVWCLGWEDSPGGGNGSPFQYSCLENPMDRGAWWATAHGVSKSRTRLSGWAHVCSHQQVSLGNLPYTWAGAHYTDPSVPLSSGSPLGQSYRIPCGKLKRLWAAEFGLGK